MPKILWVLVFVLAAFAQAYADATVLLEEPFGRFGYVNPTGHTAVYLPRVCAESPLRLRRCGPGEAGVVISRYRRVAGYDWLAIPLIPYLYAVETPGEVPASVSAKSVAALRDEYRRNHFRDLIPDGANEKMPPGDWTQLVGAAYDRKIYGFGIETSEAQDNQLIQAFNRRLNHAHFNLFIHNCADFSRNLINFYFPKAVHRGILADVGITTPKQVAKSLVAYSRRHPQLQFSTFLIPQVAGNLHRSHGVHGVLGAFASHLVGRFGDQAVRLSKDPPAEPEALRLLAPQRDLIATDQCQTPDYKPSSGRELRVRREAHLWNCQTSAASPAEPRELPAY
jgi:hypothetical protein